MSKSADVLQLNAKSRWERTFMQLRYEDFVAGLAGGVISTLVVHPFDFLKIRLSVNDGDTARPQYQGLRHAARSIFKEQGIRGLYQGCTPNCVGSGAAWGFYFVFYNAIKAYMQPAEGAPSHLGPTKHMMAAVAAGSLSLLFTNPIFVVKTRMCLQYQQDSPTMRYRGMIHAFQVTFQQEGVRGLYRGFIPGIFGTSHGACQFMVYEEMKHVILKRSGKPHDSPLSTLEYLCCAVVSKVFAVVATFPYQVVRFRLQDHHTKYHGVIGVIRYTWRNEGFFGFYKGLTPNLLRVTPAVAITFLVYEHGRQLLKPSS